ncbi:TonB-dependent receptor [Salinisphaera sp. P385]|uniref:TonB-dependent receptor n=1 Tax=Spectribacter acetivorans TaxID=3075603 RepID=A0ABU3B6C6_9GAMM|nr:TonB-dependent receptor [Salinisphaera sp. P385]MDT0617991.1 TonB-dependent receptor [Salinisphaera sp. P385]
MAALWSATAGIAAAADTPLALDTLPVIGDRPEAFDNRGIKAEQEEAALTPGGVTVIEDDILHERNTATLSDMLRYVPGVWSASHSGSDSIFISSRGSNLDATDFDRNGVKLFQDGLPVTTADGNNHNRIVDPLSARYAVFARGANAAKYGASTLGGAINFVSPTAQDSPSAQFLLNSGSHGQRQGRATASRVFNDRFDGLLTLEAKTRDGYRDHDEMRRRGVYGNAGWRITDDIGTRVYSQYVKRDLELPGQLTRQQFESDPDQASASARAGNFQADLESWRLADKTTWQIDANRRLDVGLSYEEQALFHPIVDKVIVPGAGVVFNGLLIDTDHRDIGGMARYQHRMGDHDLLFGLNVGVGDVEGEQYGNAGGARDGLSTRVDQNAHNTELFATNRWRLTDRWTLIPALQIVHGNRELDNTSVASGAVNDIEDDYTGVNPSLGIIHHRGESFDLYASVSRLYESPTTFELADDVAGDGSALDAMHGTVVEMGTRGSRPIGARGFWRWDLSVYYAWVRDEILSVDDPAAPGTSLSTNVDRTVHAGVEALVSGGLALDPGARHRLEPRLSLTLNEFNFDGHPTYGDNKLPAAPGYALRGEMLYRHAHGFYTGPTVDVVDERFADFANTYRVDDYELLGWLGGWSGERVTVYAELRNLLGEAYVSTHRVRDVAAATDALLNPGEPRSVYVGMRYRM